MWSHLGQTAKQSLFFPSKSVQCSVKEPHAREPHTPVGPVSLSVFSLTPGLGCSMDSTIHWVNHYPEDKYQQNQLRYSVDRDLSDGQPYPPFEQPGPDLLFDFSRVLEYAEIRTVLQSTLWAFRTENQYDGEWSPLFRDQMESTKATHRFVFVRDQWSLLRPRTDLSSLGIKWSLLYRATHRFVFFRDAILNFQYHPRFFFVSSRVIEVLTGLRKPLLDERPLRLAIACTPFMFNLFSAIAVGTN